MSHQHLQRVLVRMLYDPAFAADVFRDPETTLHDEQLTEQERRWLVHTDQRAYAVDPLRRTRTLAVLLEEFPVSVHHLIQHTAQPALVEDFFASAAFHACIQCRGSLAVAFGEYLCSHDLHGRYPELGIVPLVQIEAAIARLRRQRLDPKVVPSPLSSTLSLAPTVVLLPLPTGMLDYYHTVFDALRRDADGLAAAAFKASALPRPHDSSEQEWLLIEWHEETESASIELLPDALGALLAALPAERETLVATACSLGATAHEAEDILDGLVTDGVLQYGSTSPD
ncbi:MAG: hypothetical protein AB7N91_12840 [Candidatus Tectimicrobiota bacterium]